MMPVDQFFKQNGRQFCKMAGRDEVMELAGRTSINLAGRSRNGRKASPKLLDLSDLFGRNHTSLAESQGVWHQATSAARLRLEDSYE